MLEPLESQVRRITLNIISSHFYLYQKAFSWKSWRNRDSGHFPTISLADDGKVRIRAHGSVPWFLARAVLATSHNPYNGRAPITTLFKCLFYLKKFIWLHWVLYVACEMVSFSMWDLLPWLGMEPRPSVMGAWSLSQGTTREVPFIIRF